MDEIMQVYATLPLCRFHVKPENASVLKDFPGTVCGKAVLTLALIFAKES
jgi:hypothetical protein